MFSYAAILAQCILATEGARLSHSQILALYPNPVPLPPPRYTSLAPTSSAPPSTLRAAASARGIYIGAAINQACYTNASEPQYQQTYLTEFSLATCENGCKFAALEPSNGVYDFGECSLIANAALNTGKGAFRGHNFIWGESLPPWLTQGNYNGSALKGIMENHISTSLSHFASDPTLPAFECWDVVNEAVCDVGSKDFNCSSPGKPLWKETAWYPSGAGTPGGYVENAFRMARAAADAAAAHATAHAAAAAAGIKLFYNDYGGEGQGEKSDRIYAMLQDFKSRGVPVDGVGLQMHISVDGYPDPWGVSRNIQRLGSLGLEVHITEMDVRCSNCTPERLATQASIYGLMMEACLNNTGVCKSFETWGVTDRHTWLWDFENPTHTNPAPLIFGMNYEKKPAHSELLAVLQQQ